MKASMYFNYTSRSLVRGGQRTLLAIFCVAIGVLAIVSLQLVGLMINNAFNTNVRDANGGDIAVRSQNQPFKQDELDYFGQLKKNKTITDYTASISAQGSTGSRVSLRESFSVRVVNPKSYPVVTPPTFTTPTNGKIADLLKNNQVIVTQPFIDQYKKKIGDKLEIHIGSQTQGTRVIHAKIQGIVTESGVLAQAGSLVLLSIDDYKAATPQASSSAPQNGAPAQQNGSPAQQDQGANPPQNGTPAVQNGVPPQQGGTPPQQNGTPAQQGTPPAGQSGAAPPQNGSPSQSGGTSPAPGGETTAQGSTTQPAGSGTANAKENIFYDRVDIVAPATHINDAVKKIQGEFPVANTQTATDALKQQQDSIDNIRKFLEIAGLLALLIGGVGIVNTMQVLLSRRKTEIAMLKTTGYRRADLYLLFGLEAGLLGLIGGVIGALAATGVSYLVRNLVVQTFQLNIPFVLDWFTIAGGVIIGLATALIFGLLPIVQAANIRPLNVIRDLPEGRGATSVLLTIGLLIVLSVLFCVLAIVVLNNDIFLGVTSVYGTFVFLALLSLLFGLIILVVSRLPVPERFSIGYLALVVALVAISALLYLVLPAFGLLALVASLLGFIVVLLPRTMKATTKMALRNLGRQRTRTTTTMLALFVGIFTIGLILVLGQNLREQIDKLISNSLNYNVFTITANDDTTKLREKIRAIPGLSSYQQHGLASTVPVSINDKPIGTLLPRGDAAKASQTSLGRSGALYFLSGVEGFDVGNNQLPPPSSTKVIKGRNLQLSDAGTDNVVVSNLLAELDPFHVKLGDKITLASTDRSATRTVTVVGIYRSSGFSGTLEPIVGTLDTVKGLSLASYSQSIFYMKVDVPKLNQAVDVIGATVPNAFVLNLANITQFIDQLLNDILLTLTTIASLSLIAGLIIIANAVALAMLERRRELGILKSVGYTSRTILGEVLLENGVVGGLGALLAMLLVTVVTAILGAFVFKSNFAVSTYVTFSLVLGSALLAMIIAALVAWGSVRVRPLEVLRYE